MLLAADYSNIYNMSGGIISFNGGKAFGDERFGMDHFVTGEFSDVFRMSYAMEESLQQLYLALEELSDDPDVKKLLARLAQFEEGHKAKLKAMFPDITDLEEKNSAPLEGGFDKQQFLDHYGSRSVGLNDVIQMGMMLETQAFDLYSRLAKKTDGTETKTFFEFMVREEKQHLNFLSDELDRVLA